MSMSLSSSEEDPARRRRLGDRLVTFGCAAWLALASWGFFHQVPPEIVDNHTAAAMQERMRGCEGNFRQRYECKQAYLLAGERWGFAVALNRLALICGPVITAWIVWAVVRRRLD